MKVTINFDMDGTIADLYGVENWLDYLTAENPFPYETAEPLLYFSSLARKLNSLQRAGYEIAIISWLSKAGSDTYNSVVADAKKQWLRKHLPSVHWDRIIIVPYGTPKESFCNSPLDILFDDEERNRENWTGIAFDALNIMETLRGI